MRFQRFNVKLLTTLHFIILLSFAALNGCQRSEQTAVNAPPPSRPSQEAAPAPNASPSPVAAASASPASPAAPPEPAEVQGALTRVYQNVVAADASRGDYAVTGDFNGDGSQDIAVVVKPDKAQLSEINSEVANWIIVDPQRVKPPQEIRAHQQLPPPAPARVEAGDTLLAVIHGYEARGWRNPEAKQTYLLKNAVGDGMRTQPAQDALKAEKDKRPQIQLRGDLIWEKLAGKTGCLYWTGAKYAWYDESEPHAAADTKDAAAHTAK